MKKLTKKIVAGTLSLAIAFTGVSWQSSGAVLHAEELNDSEQGILYSVEESQENEEFEEYDIEDFDYDNEELFETYAGKILGIYPDFSVYSLDIAGNHLTGKDAMIYQVVKQMVEDVAAGKRTSTLVGIPLNQMASKLQFTSAELGGVELIVNDAVNKEAYNKARPLVQAQYDYATAMKAVMTDCPYELYWGKHSYGGGISVTYGVKYDYDIKEYVFYFDGDESEVNLGFMADSAYVGETAYSVNLSKIGVANRAADNAKTIVAEAAAKTDYEKLDYYREKLCDLITYDTTASKLKTEEITTYAPWELINVFDGNADTNVVCEGYSKAFAYLCELTTFDSPEIYAYTVDGIAGGSHMWNIVHMDDEKNYLVDVTNCDGSSIGAPNRLFLRGYQSFDNANKAYTIFIPRRDLENGAYYPETTFTYQYGTSTLAEYSWDELELADSDYDPNKVPQVLTNVPKEFSLCTGSELTEVVLKDFMNWTWDESNGALTVPATVGESVIAKAVYIGQDKDLYSNTTVNVTITAKAHDIYTEQGTADPAKEKCTACGIRNINYSGLTITARTETYSGNTYTAQISGTISTNYLATGNKQKNAGTYTITLTGKGNYAGTRTVEWIIEPKQLTPSLKGSVAKEYDGTTTIANADSVSITLSGVAYGENVTAFADYAFVDVEIGENKEIIASNIQLSGDTKDNYALTTSTLSANIGTITKATPTGIVVPTGFKGNCGESVTQFEFKDSHFRWSADYPLVATGGTESPTVQQYAARYTPDDQEHYKEITVLIDIEVTHVPGSGTHIDGTATHKLYCAGCTRYIADKECYGGKETCQKGKICEVCKNEYTEKIPTAHTFKDYNSYYPATCTQDAYDVATCIYCYEQDRKVRPGTATGHSYGYPVFRWAEDASTCIAIRTCSTLKCGVNKEEGRELSYVCTITSTEKVAATPSKKGIMSYTATFTTAEGEQYQDIKELEYEYTGACHQWKSEVNSEISGQLAKEATCVTPAEYYKYCEICKELSDETFAATGSEYGHEYGSKFSWAEDNKSCICTLTCSRIGCTAEMSGHQVEGECEILTRVTKEPTCNTKGTTLYYATYSIVENMNYYDWKFVDDIGIDETLHQWVEQVNEDIEGQVAKEATCIAPAQYYKYCKQCEKLSEEVFEGTKVGNHSYKLGKCNVCGDETDERKQAKAFSERMYTKALGRAAEEAGVEHWTNQLMSKEMSAALLSTFFLTGTEIGEQNISDEEFANRCYATLFDRAADQGGFDNWMKYLNNGMSRTYVLAGFCLAPEYVKLCEGFGVIPGTIELTEPADQNPNITAYVSRCYLKTLGRSGDRGGVNNWADSILKGKMAPKDVAHFFITSDEFLAKGLNNRDYVEVLYQMFFDRAGDAGGVTYWVGSLDAGAMNREAAFQGFAYSQEFDKILEGFGLQ